MEITDTFYATLIATVISSLVTIILSLVLKRKDDRRELDLQLDTILKIAVEYPYLESSSFTATWKDNHTNPDEKYRRYETYATLVFNYLSRVSKFYKYNIDKINDYIDITGWVKLHRTYWHNPTEPNENELVYDQRFKNIIHSILGEIAD